MVKSHNFYLYLFAGRASGRFSALAAATLRGCGAAARAGQSKPLCCSTVCS
eukprot:COSAG02_NODE_63064_length_264_cov_0.630303_1_plen_50_part_10